MKRLTVASTVFAIVFTAFASNATVPEKSSGLVVMTGTVQQVKSEKEFTLRDNSGSVNVRLSAPEARMILDEGDSVTITGSRSGAAIDAYSIELHTRAQM